MKSGAMLSDWRLAMAPMLMTCMPALEDAYTVHRVWPLSPEERTSLLAEVGPRIRAIATDGHHGVNAETVTMERSDTTGRVNARLTLQASI